MCASLPLSPGFYTERIMKRTFSTTQFQLYSAQTHFWNQMCNFLSQFRRRDGTRWNLRIYFLPPSSSDIVPSHEHAMRRRRLVVRFVRSSPRASSGYGSSCWSGPQLSTGELRPGPLIRSLQAVVSLLPLYASTDIIKYVGVCFNNQSEARDL